MEAQLAMAVREAMIREGVDTKDYYIVTQSYTVSEDDVITASMKIVDDEGSIKYLTFYLRELERDFFEVI